MQQSGWKHNHFAPTCYNNRQVFVWAYFYKIWMSIKQLWPIKVPILSTMQSNTLLTILFLYIPVLLFINHKEMDKLSL